MCITFFRIILTKCMAFYVFIALDISTPHLMGFVLRTPQLGAVQEASSLVAMAY